MKFVGKAVIWGLALVLALGVVAVVPAQSNDAERALRVQQALANLQEFLTRNREMVQNSENEKAKELWGKAEEAAAAAATALGEGKLDEAMRAISRARQLAENAIREVRGVGGNTQMMRERLLREIVQLREQEERCRQLLEGLDCPNGQRALERGREAADQARRLLSEQQYGAAEQAARRAQQFFTQCYREILLCGDNVSDRIAQQISALEELILEVEALLLENPNPEAENALAAAKDALARAKELLQAENPDLRAVQAHLARARELAHHARRLLAGAPTTGDHIKKLCERHLAMLRNHLAVAHNIVDQSTSEEAKAKLAEADALAVEAVEAYEAGQYRECLSKTTQAMRLINQAILLARRNAGNLPPPPAQDFLRESAERALAAWEETAARVAPIVAASTNEHVQDLWTQAQALAEEAKAAFEVGRYGETVQKVSAAIQLASRAAMLASQPSHPRPPGSGNQ